MGSIWWPTTPRADTHELCCDPTTLLNLLLKFSWSYNLKKGRKYYIYQYTRHILFMVYMVSNHSDSNRENQLPPLHELHFSISNKGFFYMHHPTNRIIYTTSFFTQIMEHWESSMASPSGIDPMTYHTTSEHSSTKLCRGPADKTCHVFYFILLFTTSPFVDFRKKLSPLILIMTEMASE